MQIFYRLGHFLPQQVYLSKASIFIECLLSNGHCAWHWRDKACKMVEGGTANRYLIRICARRKLSRPWKPEVELTVWMFWEDCPGAWVQSQEMNGSLQQNWRKGGGEREESVVGRWRGHSIEMWNNIMPANKCRRKTRGRMWRKMSLERKVGKVESHAKKFGLCFRTGVGWQYWEWLPSLGPIPRGSRNFCEKTHKATKCKGNVGKAHT